jgi:hypothetical protein
MFYRTQRLGQKEFVFLGEHAGCYSILSGWTLGIRQEHSQILRAEEIFVRLITDFTHSHPNHLKNTDSR